MKSNAASRDADTIVGKTMTVNDVIAEIEKDIIFYDESDGGVTFSGGEPLMQPEFLLALVLGLLAMLAKPTGALLGVVWLGMAWARSGKDTLRLLTRFTPAVAAMLVLLGVLTELLPDLSLFRT